MICPNCNCELVDGTAVCPYCGTPLAAPTADATATMPAVQQAPAPGAPAPSYRVEDIPVPETAQPAAPGYGTQGTAASTEPAAYSREETAALSPAPSRDPYADYYSQASAAPSAPAYREPVSQPAPQPTRDAYADYYRSSPAPTAAAAYRESAPQPARDPYADYYSQAPAHGGQADHRDPYGDYAAPGERRARDAHMESEDKNRVEHNVDDGAD